MLQKKTALITGSTGGIGLGIAETLAAKGVDIALNGLDEPEKNTSLCAELSKKFNVTVRYFQADVTNAAAIHKMIDAIIQQFGRLDILVNNAGIQHVESIETFPAAKWDIILAINLSAAFHTTQAVIPHMKRNDFGRIINIASVHGIKASRYKSAYIAAKHGLVGLSKAAALDLAPFGITVNALCPGYVDTPLVRKQIPEQAKSHNISEQEVIEKILLKEHAIKEFVSVEQLGAFVAFLASAEGATITGAALTMDAGWTA